MNRREFLQSTAATAAAAGLVRALPAEAQGEAHAVEAWPENGTLIPDDGWRLWVDREAQWKTDAIFLPEDISQDAEGIVRGKGEPLPVNAPTGGWAILAGAPVGSIEVNLPDTVEQHFWGKYGAGDDGRPRPYLAEEYRYAPDDPVPQNGAYFGVSWWYRPIDIPASMAGKRIFLHIRGAHLRAEVYLNQKLVGYSIMEELPFEAELTNAAKPGGENHLAIRITNPFGRFDWVDGLNEQWGAVKIYRSHGFGGMDRGLTISAHDGVRIKDAWVLNKVQHGAIVAKVAVDSPLGVNDVVETHFEVIDPSTGKVVAESGRASSATPGLQVTLVEGSDDSAKGETTSGDLSLDDAKIWDLNTPRLYHLRASVTTRSGKKDSMTRAFGFRSFGVDGIGTNALFRLNGRRMKIYTAISWGYWGINGMWPTPELAVKEVTQAKKLNLTCLNFHRNLAKEEVLRAHDRLGLLRYMEPGAGKMAIGKLPSGVQANAAGIVMEKATNPADVFAQRYMFTKCVEMVKAYRSHPCVIEYCLQNEIGADLKNPDTLAVLKAMHDEDPSRCVVLNDGFVARGAAQAWYAPWDADLKSGELYRSDQEQWGDWWNNHQGAGDQWYDRFYKDPSDFTYKSPERKAISEFGEMEGCATPDNHSLMLHELADPRGTGIGNQPPNQSYDLQDHREIEAAASAFLSKWGFREAFPATEKLWTSLGKKCYDTWQNYMENARISDELDFCAISGWESTAIENHSGIVDNLRNYKSDPGPITGTLLPVRPVAKQRAACTALGEAATFDLLLLNDTNGPATGTLSFTAVSPSGKLIKLGEFPAPEWKRDQFSYMVKEAFITPQLAEEGLWRFRFALSSAPASTQTKEIWVAHNYVNKPVTKCAVVRKIAVSGIPSGLRKQLSEALEACDHLEDFKPGEKYDVIVSAGLVTGAATAQNSGDQTGLETQPSGAARRPAVQPGALADGILDAVKAGTPLLAIPQTDALSDGVAKQLAATGAFTYNGNVGDLRAPWMGNWYFVRKHPLFDGMPQDQAMGFFYQADGHSANGLVVDRAAGGAEVEIIAAYSRDHSRVFGAGTFTTKLGAGKIVYHRVPDLQPVLQQRFLANALRWLSS